MLHAQVCSFAPFLICLAIIWKSYMSGKQMCRTYLPKIYCPHSYWNIIKYIIILMFIEKIFPWFFRVRHDRSSIAINSWALISINPHCPLMHVCMLKENIYKCKRENPFNIKITYCNFHIIYWHRDHWGICTLTLNK